MYRNNSNKFPGGILQSLILKKGVIRERGLYEREAYSRERLIRERGLFKRKAYSNGGLIQNSILMR